MIKLETIAQLAGVSKTTVSLVINGKPGVSPQKRDEVLRLIEEYNYKPLRKKKIKQVKQVQYEIRLLVCNDVHRFTYNFQQLPHFSELINDFMILANEYAVHLTINTISINHFDKDLLALEKKQSSDALILLGTDLPENILNLLNEIHNRIVVIDTDFDHLNNNFISINNVQGAYIATKHLIEQGHQEIGYVMANERIQNFQQRHRGFAIAMKEHNLNPKQFHPLVFPANNINTYPDRVNLNRLATAYFCENDSIAISLIRSLQSHGIKVPQDVSVIGFDNIAESAIITPELTTIDIKRQVLVQQSLEKALQIIRGHNLPNTHLKINTHLIQRGSVAKIK